MQDIRVYQIMADLRLNDNSFKEKGLLGLFKPKFSQEEVREIWFQGMEIGVEEGLRKGSIQGQKIDLYNNCTKPRQKEFLEKFYKLAKEYNCAIVYHPMDGMCVMDLNRD